MACVYKHVFADNVIYFGNGQSSARAYDQRPRNNKWQQALEEFSKYAVEIVANNITAEEADALERSLFLDYVTNGGVKLQNTPSGKDLVIQTKRSKRSSGMTGYQHSDATKQRLRDKALGHSRNLGRKATPECCENISKAKTGRPNWKLRGVLKSSSHRRNISEAKKGKPGHTPSDVTRAKVSLSQKGKQNAAHRLVVSTLDGRVTNASGAGKITKRRPEYAGTWIDKETHYGQ